MQIYRRPKYNRYTKDRPNWSQRSQKSCGGVGWGQTADQVDLRYLRQTMATHPHQPLQSTIPISRTAQTWEAAKVQIYRRPKYNRYIKDRSSGLKGLKSRVVEWAGGKLLIR